MNLALLLARVDDLREVTLSSDLLGIADLLWRLVLRWLVCVVFW